MLQMFWDPNCIHWTLVVITGLGTIMAYVICRRHREMIDRALKGAVEIPENMHTYDDIHLNRFRSLASKRKTEFGDTALQHYVHPTLLWNDAYFAVSFSALLFLTGFISAALVEGDGFLRHGLQFCGIMGLLYGIFDIMEDIYLARLLGAESPVSPPSATLASWLTRLKLASLCLSVLGIPIWMVLGFLYQKFKA